MSETVGHNSVRSRYELFVDGELAGYAHYRLSNGVARFDRVALRPHFRDAEIGTTLVRGAFDQVRAAGQWKIRAVASIVSNFRSGHPEYDDLVVT